MAQESSPSNPTAAASDTPTPPPVFNPPYISFDEVDEKFQNSNCAFRANISHYFENPIMNGRHLIRKRSRLTILKHINTTNETKRMSAYLMDEWSDILKKIWTSYRAKVRDNAQISITFYKIKVEAIPQNERDPLQAKHVAFVVDKNVPDDAWIEFNTCCSRICGRNGIRLTYTNVLNHFNKNIGSQRQQINLKNNLNFLIPSYPYVPATELQQFKKRRGYIYAYVSFSTDTKPCTGMHQWYKQIRIRDCTLAWDADDLQVMVFSNHFDAFPQVKDGDLIRLHRICINFREFNGLFQCVLQLDNKTLPPASFIVIDGNLTIPNNKEAVKQSSSNNYSWDDAVDGYFVKYLKEACRIRQENMNPEFVNNNNNNINMNNNISNVLSVNQIPFKLLNEINENDTRINLMVMITTRIDIINVNNNHNNNNNDMDIEDNMNDDISESDHFEFYWIIWDGTMCDKNQHLLKLYDRNQEHINEEDKWEVDHMYNNANIIGSSVKLLVSPDYETGIMCYNDIRVGSWVEFTNLLINQNRHELMYDKHSKLCTNVHVKSDRRIQRRLDRIHYNICNNTHMITHTSSINPHHAFQSYSSIKTIITIPDIHCRYKIRGKAVDYFPKNIQLFCQHKINNENVLQFILCIKGASGSIIKVIFAGKEAKTFFSMDTVCDLRDVNHKKELDEIGHCLEIIMNESSIMDICIRSYKVRNKNYIAYKAFDTVLIK